MRYFWKKKKNMSCRFLLKNTPLPMGPWLVNWHHSRVPTNVLSYASDHQCIRVSYLKGSFSLCSVHSMEDYFQKRGINIVRRSQIFSGYKREHHYLFKQINCPFPEPSHNGWSFSQKWEELSKSCSL